MNAAIQGIRNAFRNVIRTGSIVIILSISIGLIIAMLAARQAVDAKIENVKSSVGNTISISPAGFRGFEGGGSGLTTVQITKVKAVSHVASVTSSLSDRLSTSTTSTDSTTNLTSGIDAGSLGQRFGGQAPSNASTGSNANTNQAPQSGTTNGSNSTTQQAPQGNPMTSITITGVDSVASTSVFGGSSLTWTSGQAFDASADTENAVVGKVLAEKNSLKVGSTFTAYGKTLTVVGIYDAGTQFANNGIFVSLSALQRLSDQSGTVTSATARVDSIDNLSSTTTAITSALGSGTADVTNNQEAADSAIAPLKSVKNISLYSLIGAIVAGAVIILLTMIMIVRERRREIGVMKAIGASNVNIMTQFVFEALTLTTIALIIGTVIGIVASSPLADMLVSTSSSSTQTMGMGGPGRPGGGQALRGLQQTATNIQAAVGLTTLLYGIGATFLIAILGSAIPSLMISKIKPAEAMRSE